MYSKLEPLIPYVASAISAVFFYFVGKRKQVAETEQTEQNAKGTELDNVQTALKTYREMLDNLRNDLLKINTAYDELEVKFHDQVKKVRVLELKNFDLSEENHRLKMQIRTCGFDCDAKENLKE